MSTPPITELTSRARDIFRLVVEGYLSSGQPVGSKTLAGAGVNLSPASIRSVLHELEMLGLLAAPHTSAGRLPTELGLRFFVDAILEIGDIAADERETKGERALLNLGHTFAHAYEAIAGYDGGLLHGEAVAIGISSKGGIQ